MKSNNHQQSFSCKFAEDLVGYLYNEIGSGRQVKFENHLDNCSHCRDDLAAFGFVRSAIGDWREEVFAELPAPQIAVPYRNNEPANRPAADDRLSLVERIRRLFAQTSGWATASAAFAVLALVLGITFFAVNYKSTDELTAVQREIGVESDSSALTPEPAEIPVQIPNQESAQQTSETADAPVNPVSRPKLIKAPTPAGSDQAKPAVKQIVKPDRATLAVDNRNLPDKNATPLTNTGEVPRLSDLADEYEDDSLRLADLFDEVGSKR